MPTFFAGAPMFEVGTPMKLLGGPSLLRGAPRFQAGVPMKLIRSPAFFAGQPTFEVGQPISLESQFSISDSSIFKSLYF